MSKVKEKSAVKNRPLTQDLIKETESLRRGGKLDKSIAAAKKILALKDISLEESLRTKLIIAGCYSAQGRYDESLALNKEVLTLAKKIDSDPFICRSLANIGIHYITLANYQTALEYLSQALSIADAISDTNLLSGIINHLGGIYLAMTNYPKALDCLSRALTLTENTDDKYWKSQILNKIGLLYYQQSDNEKALKYFLHALEINEEKGDYILLGGCLGNIGSLYNRLHDYQKALEFHSRSAMAEEKNGETENLAIAFGNMGIDYSFLNDYPQALHYLQRALDLSNKIGAQRPAGYWMLEIARIDHKLGNHDTAQQGLVAVLQHMRDISTNELVADILVELGNVLKEKGEIDQAFQCFTEAIQLADRLSEKLSFSKAARALSEIYFQKGDVTSAYEYLNKHVTIEKEIFGDEIRRRIEAFNIQKTLEFEAKEKEIEKMKRQQVEKELSSASMHLAMQTELLSTFRDDLRQIVREIDEPIAALKKIKEKLRELPCEQIDWVKFENQFTDVHPEFKSKLIEKYPDLTKQEVKMCQLARLGLKSFEMSRLLCLSERTVEGHRLNLRKKLGVKTEEKLSEFLAKV